ncbi:hypothetical protein [Nocardioides sp. cx-173]|nr:hypothetical protein [Nocardioides sp. cx-173]MCD4526015.1 hypothetical protein [Nocardioides sp. cx-173]UGB43710.1 hypothetical protein LQ940_09340 [Nocardioides sp. cx-173]
MLGPDLDALLSRDGDAETVAAAVAAAVEDAGAPDNYSVVVVDLAS